MAFRTKEVAQQAIKELHGKDFKVPYLCLCFIVVDSCQPLPCLPEFSSDLFLASDFVYLVSLQGRTIRCSLSDTKYRLFIGNVPRSWTDDEFRNVIEETGPGVENIELIKA